MHKKQKGHVRLLSHARRTTADEEVAPTSMQLEHKFWYVFLSFKDIGQMSQASMSVYFFHPEEVELGRQHGNYHLHSLPGLSEKQNYRAQVGQTCRMLERGLVPGMLVRFPQALNRYWTRDLANSSLGDT